ncbi:MAG: hypothetical protein K2X32_03335, partial [Phycisphaerales bacterium]|nr:hypothetical protein [Phycisphaerales bacterium]
AVIGTGGDTDLDGLSDELERRLGTDPSEFDTDQDGLGDGFEVFAGLDPLTPDSNGNGIPDGDEDLDGDGLTNTEEQNWGANPLSTDSDGDGMPDATEVQQGRLPGSRADGPNSPGVCEVLVSLSAGLDYESRMKSLTVRIGGNAVRHRLTSTLQTNHSAIIRLAKDASYQIHVTVQMHRRSAEATSPHSENHVRWGVVLDSKCATLLFDPLAHRKLTVGSAPPARWYGGTDFVADHETTVVRTAELVLPLLQLYDPYKLGIVDSFDEFMNYRPRLDVENIDAEFPVAARVVGALTDGSLVFTRLEVGGRAIPVSKWSSLDRSSTPHIALLGRSRSDTSDRDDVFGGFLSLSSNVATDELRSIPRQRYLGNIEDRYEFMSGDEWYRQSWPGARLDFGAAWYEAPINYLDGHNNTNYSRTGNRSTLEREYLQEPLFVPEPGIDRLSDSQDTVTRLGVTTPFTRTRTETSTPLVLRRPPLVLIHGINSSPAAWNEWRPAVQGYEWHILNEQVHEGNIPTSIYKVNYESTNTQGYSENLPKLSREIRDALNDARALKFAATQVDVIGHSMGGQITRLYMADPEDRPDELSRSLPRAPSGFTGWPNSLLRRSSTNPEYRRPDNCFRGDIRRFIAIGSPFRGSPWANEVEKYLRPAGRDQANVVIRGVLGAANKTLLPGPLERDDVEIVDAANLVSSVGRGDRLRDSTCYVDLRTDSPIERFLRERALYGGDVRWIPISTVRLGRDEQWSDGNYAATIINYLLGANRIRVPIPAKLTAAIQSNAALFAELSNTGDVIVSLRSQLNIASTFSGNANSPSLLEPIVYPYQPGSPYYRSDVFGRLQKMHVSRVAHSKLGPFADTDELAQTSSTKVRARALRWLYRPTTTFHVGAEDEVQFESF